jgi:hypothetical protein
MQRQQPVAAVAITGGGGVPTQLNLVTEATIDREQYRGAIHHLLFIHGGNLDLIFLLRNLVLP